MTEQRLNRFKGQYIKPDKKKRKLNLERLSLYIQEVWDSNDGLYEIDINPRMFGSLGLYEGCSVLTIPIINKIKANDFLCPTCSIVEIRQDKNIKNGYAKLKISKIQKIVLQGGKV